MVTDPERLDVALSVGPKPSLRPVMGAQICASGLRTGNLAIHDALRRHPAWLVATMTGVGANAKLDGLDTDSAFSRAFPSCLVHPQVQAA